VGVKTDIKQTFDTKTFPIESYTDGDYNKKVVCVIVVFIRGQHSTFGVGKHNI